MGMEVVERGAEQVARVRKWTGPHLYRGRICSSFLQRAAPYHTSVKMVLSPLFGYI